METHVKVLGVLHIVCGIMGVLGALVLMVIFGGVAGLVGADADPDAAIAVPIIGVTGAVLVVFVLLFSEVFIGFGLYRLRPWARMGGLVWSILELFAIPVGTAIGIYGLWVLFSKETERLFGGGTATP
jgi:hypothetical protein